LKLVGLLVEPNGESVASVFAFAAAKDVVLLKQQNTGFYPANWANIFVSDITFDVNPQLVRRRLEFKVLARTA
jgi:hypothetical protein